MKSKSVLLESLFPALRRLDGMLGSAIERARRESNAAEAFRGLYIAHADIQRSLRGAPGDPRYSTRAADEFAPVDSPLARLVAEYELCPFDLDILLIVLAPEIDRRYERVYAYLQDDVTRRRPTVDLCLDLLCNSELDRIARRLHFAPDAPLIRHGIVELGADSGVGLLGQALWVDDQIVSLLLEHSAIDRRAAAFCRYLDASADPLSSRHATVVELVRRAYAENAPLLLGLAGAPGSGKRRTASAIASAAGLPLLELDTGALLRADPTLVSGLRLALREARWRGAALYISGTEHLEIEAHAVERRTLQRALESQRGIVMLASTRAVSLLFGALAIEPMRIGSLLPAERQQVWLGVLGAAAEQVSPEELKILAERFRLTAGDISRAAAHAVLSARARGGSSGAVTVTLEDLFAGARMQSRRELSVLAQRIEPVRTWPDLVLPPDQVEQLHEICARVACGPRVLDDWGFAARLSHARGCTALFSGPSGTGKTMAAEVLASALGLDLYRIDLASVVSKYIGETEKNLDVIFGAAEGSNAILFFDEADALFGKRSEVRDSHDRYANLEISYLLQRMEQLDGVAILATNLRGNLDDAFVRRLQFSIHFPFPDEASRRRIWEGVWPAAAPLAPTVDLRVLARQFKLSGGHIRNVALASAFLAANDGGTVTTEHVLHAIRCEYQKIGKTMSAAEVQAAMQGA